MPSLIGAYKINSNTGILNNGDTAIIAPTTSAKTYNGSGSGLTGDLAASYTGFNFTITNDPDAVDSTPVRGGNGG